MTDNRFESLQARLFFLVLVAVLPALLLIVYIGVEQHTWATENTHRTNLETARTLLNQQDDLTQETHEIFDKLALEAVVTQAAQDPEACSRFLAEWVTHGAPYLDLGVADQRGQVLCHAVPTASTPNLADQLWFQQATAQVGPLTSAYAFDPTTRTTALYFGQAFQTETTSQPLLVVYAVIALNEFKSSMTHSEFPTGTVVTWLDQSGLVLARSQDAEQWVGKLSPETTLVQLLTLVPDGGTIETRGVDNSTELFAYLPAGIYGQSASGQPLRLYVAVSIPLAIAFADADRTLAFNVLAFILVAWLALSAAWFGSDYFIARHMRTLIQTTRRIAAGEAKKERTVPHQTGELGVLARTFDDMAATLAQHQHSLTETQGVLFTSEERYRTVVEALKEGIILVDAAGVIQAANPSAARIFGIKPRELIGLSLHEVQWDIIREDGTRFIQKDFPPLVTLNTGRSSSDVVMGVAQADGERLWISINSRPLFYPGTTAPYAAVTSLEDISERKRHAKLLEAERASLARRVEERTADLSAANAQIARVMRTKDEFLANISHELRTPLNSVLGLSEALQEGVYGGLNERQLLMLRNITESGQHLLALINDVLDISKIEAGRMELILQPLDVRELCQASVRLVRQAAQQKKLNIVLDLEHAPELVLGDLRRLKQILVNLLGNAIKFTPTNGALGLEVVGDVENETVLFTVWDTGIGIAPADQARLFQPFIQLDSSLSRQYEGTGLGLSLVRRLAALHGGSVSLESAPNHGSRFKVALPWRNAQALTAPPTPAPFSTLPIRRAMIIEDSPTAAGQLMRYLDEFGFEAVVLQHGEGVLDHVLEIHPNLIVLDIQLPDISGWDILQQLKQDPRTQAIPLMIATIVDEPVRGLAQGANEYLLKPITREQLQLALRHIFADSPTPEGPSGPRHPADGAERPLILIAEDNEASLNMLTDYLHSLDYRVITAHNGLEALERAREQPPDIILMDVQMPGMDGLDAIRHLRADPNLAGITVIAITALAMPGDRERCLTAGADEYLTKPISLKGLLGVIERLLQQPTT